VPGLLRLKLSEDFTFFFYATFAKTFNLCEEFAHGEHFGEPGRPMDRVAQHIDGPEVALENSIPVLEVGSGFILGTDGNRFTGNFAKSSRHLQD
jgi:hypothetical protein